MRGENIISGYIGLRRSLRDEIMVRMSLSVIPRGNSRGVLNEIDIAREEEIE